MNGKFVECVNLPTLQSDLYSYVLVRFLSPYVLLLLTNVLLGLIYHPHLRPILSPAAALLSLSATLHDQPTHVLPTPADALRKLGSLGRSLNDTPTASHSLANLLETHPIHVEQVAQAICLAIERPDVEGPVNVKEMRRLIGWGTSDGVEQSAQPLGQS